MFLRNLIYSILQIAVVSSSSPSSSCSSHFQSGDPSQTCLAHSIPVTITNNTNGIRCVPSSTSLNCESFLGVINQISSDLDRFVSRLLNCKCEAIENWPSVDASAYYEIEEIYSDLSFLEGPIVVEEEGHLNALFFGSHGTGVMKMKLDNNENNDVTVYHATDANNGKSVKAHGLSYEPNTGSVLFTSFVVPGDVYRITNETDETRSERISLIPDDITLHSPNDIIVRRIDGMIYFTDFFLPILKQAPTFDIQFGIYMIDPSSSDVWLEYDFLEEQHGIFSSPNGLAFNSDETKLYATCSFISQVFEFDVDADSGHLSFNRILPNNLPTSSNSNDNGDLIDGIRLFQDNYLLLATGLGYIEVRDISQQQAGETLFVVDTYNAGIRAMTNLDISSRDGSIYITNELNSRSSLWKLTPIVPYNVTSQQPFPFSLDNFY